MIGLVALGFVGLAFWVAKLGWEGFRSRGPQAGRSVAHVIGFVALSATLAAAVFVASAAMFTGQSIYILSFAVWMALLNIGAMLLLALPIRAAGSYGLYVADALRVGPVFFLVYWSTLAKPVMKLFGIQHHF
jgi:hypothetical protein